MSIKILSVQLANQIAAGEVVERPASVVKELLENSLDAGAHRIEIDIEQGGCKKILVRDNGKGMSKNDVELSLKRHATSKIGHVDDLSHIVSLGFRGEALASMSSISRLTISSRQDKSETGWQAYAEGSQMVVYLQPVAHDVGTTVEVLDIFFNVPARRRFLKSNKTEFAHIEEQVKRIALSKDELDIYLKHNGKVVKQIRNAKNESERRQRIGSICGRFFIKNAMNIVRINDDIALHGYIAMDETDYKLSEQQYFFVNGRFTKDRLLHHAIKQSLESFNISMKFGFILYLTLPANEVDVNVHPTKHEVRFHQSRLIHDFIVQGMIEAIEKILNISQKKEDCTLDMPYKIKNVEKKTDKIKNNNDSLKKMSYNLDYSDSLFKYKDKYDLLLDKKKSQKIYR